MLALSEHDRLAICRGVAHHAAMRAAFLALLFSAPCVTADDVEPIARHAIAAMRIDDAAGFLAADVDGVWIARSNRIDKFVRGESVPVAGASLHAPCGVAAVAFNAVWVADCKEHGVHRINRFDGNRIALVRTGLADSSGLLRLATGAGTVWVLSDAAGELIRIDPRTNAVSARIAVAADSHAAAFGFGSLWITNARADSVQRIDPRTNRVVATIPVGRSPGPLAAGERAVWVLNRADGSVTRIDPDINAPAATIETDASGSGSDIDAGGGRVWVRGSRTLLSVIHPQLNRIVARYGSDAGGGSVRVAGGAVWVSSAEAGTLWVLPAPLAAD
jgi:YVTN family beta-propeller protein